MTPSVTDFSVISLSASLLEVVQELGFTSMTPIQAQALPLLLAGKDLVGQAKTGSGKTVAFSLPILEKINLDHRTIQALVLCPTRELCTQVAGEIRKLGRKHSGLQVLIVAGGQPIAGQLSALEKGVHIVVGTPGRVLDHIIRKSLDLRSVSTLVLDEADRMLDMGFQEEMERILKDVPRTRQTSFFSATFPKSIEDMSKEYQRRPVRVAIEEEKMIPASIKQIYYEASPQQKFKALLWVLHQNQHDSALVFCNFKASVVELVDELQAMGLSAEGLHGDLEQRDRDRVMAKFRNLSTRLLVATDVAARGIDVDDLNLVINYELPPQPENYVHRIGRTGRAGKKGTAISFVMPKERGKVSMFERETGHAIESKKLVQLENLDPEKLASGIPSEAKMETLYISGGRKDKVRPADILGALTGEAGRLKGEDVGKIEIHDRFTYVAVTKKVAYLALERLRLGKIKGRKFKVERVK